MGEAHPDYAGSLNNLAGSYHSMGDSARAERLATESSRDADLLRPKTSTALGERQRLRSWPTSLRRLDGYLSVAPTMARTRGVSLPPRPRLEGSGRVPAQAEDRLVRDQPELRPASRSSPRSVPGWPASIHRAGPSSAGAWRQQLDEAARAEGDLEADLARRAPALRRAAARPRAWGRTSWPRSCPPDRPDRPPRIHPLQPTRGRQGRLPAGAAAAGVRPAPRPARRPRAAGGGQADQRGSRGLAAGPRCAADGRPDSGGRRAGPAGLGAAAAPPGRRPHRPGRPRRRSGASRSPPCRGAGPART